MKLNGFVGKGSGKLGSSVFAISGGEQIVRQYNPVVSNPSTDAQVDQRCRMKLMSQLAAAMAPAIAIKKQGLKSSRNLFIKKNFELAEPGGDQAQIELQLIQLTNGTQELGSLAATRGQNNALNVTITLATSNNLAGAEVAVFKVTEGNKLSFVSLTNLNYESGTSITGTVAGAETECVVYAYGVLTKDEAGKTLYENYQVDNGGEIASLVAGALRNSSALGATTTVGTVVGLE